MKIIQIMSLGKKNIKFAFPALVMLAVVFCCGCLTYSFGDVAYNDGTLDLEIMNNGEPKEVTVQVTVFDLSGFRQIESGKYVNSVFLESGENDCSLSLELNEGSYKLYLYVLEDGKRSSAVIRNIEVK